MKENTILKIAMIFSMIGLVVLYFVSNNIEIEEYKISELNSNIGDDVKVKGIIKRFNKAENVMFMDVEQKIISKVVIFSDEDLNLTVGDFVEIIGEVEEYKGEEEIIANRVRVVR